MESNLNQETGDYNVPSPEEREPWKDMAQRLSNELRTLFQKEGQLVRTEFNEKMNQVQAASSSMVVGVTMLLVGVQCLAVTAIILLAQVTAVWVAAVIVTLLILAVGGLIFASAKKKFNAEDFKPKKSIEAFDHIRFSLKEKVNEITKH